MHIPPYITARVIAFSLSLIFFFFLYKGSYHQKKNSAGIFISLMITLFLLFFSMKLITNLPMLLESPLSVLAYPSGTLEFYLAMIVFVFYYIRGFRKGEISSAYNPALVQLLSGSLFLFYVFTMIVYDKNDLLELVIWFAIYVGVILFKDQWPMILAGGMIAAGTMSLTMRSLDLMGVRVDGIFYLILSVVFLFIRWKQRRSQ